MAKQSSDTAPDSNVSSELWAEALANFTLDTSLIQRGQGIVKRARARRKKNQAKYAEQGIPSVMVAQLAAEADMSEIERINLYAIEQVGRRALDLWSAETPEDFQRIIDRAAATLPATGAGADTRAAVNARVNGFNGTFHGQQTRDDNPHDPGTRQYVEWDKGCSEALTEMAEIEAFFSIEPATEPTTILERDEAAYRAPKPRGRPRKQASTSSVEDAPAVTTEELDQAPPSDTMFGDMPTVPGLPN